MTRTPQRDAASPPKSRSIARAGRAGPALVATGAVLWASDALFRSKVIGDYTPLMIVFVTHALSLVVTLPSLWFTRHQLRGLTTRETGALVFIAACGSVLAMVLFTASFAMTSNYTTPILMQKMQPLFALALARLLLGERPSRRFPLWAAAALGGAYLLSFGWSNPWEALAGDQLLPAILALLAAAIWGGTTVAGRLLLGGRDFMFVTAARFSLATLFSALVVGGFEGFAALPVALTHDLVPFLLMAFVSGLAPLMLYYYGLKSTPAATASLCELAFPLAAVVINWAFLGATLSAAQIVGATVLVAAITVLSVDHEAVATPSP